MKKKVSTKGIPIIMSSDKTERTSLLSVGINENEGEPMKILDHKIIVELTYPEPTSKEKGLCWAVVLDGSRKILILPTEIMENDKITAEQISKLNLQTKGKYEITITGASLTEKELIMADAKFELIHETKIIPYSEDNETMDIVQYSPMLLQERKQKMTDDWAYFEWMKSDIIKPDDWHISGNTKFLKKSGYRKLKQGFRLKLSIISKELVQFDPPLIIRAKQKYYHYPNNVKTLLMEKGDKIEIDWQYVVICRATMPDGTFSEQTGIVASWENNAYLSTHDALGKAVTRAHSRAIADEVGYGVYSQEDIQ